MNSGTGPIIGKHLKFTIIPIFFLLKFLSFSEVTETLSSIYDEVDFVICSGGVSMGDKDFIKPVLEKLGFNLQVGRVNMKPG